MYDRFIINLLILTNFWEKTVMRYIVLHCCHFRKVYLNYHFINGVVVQSVPQEKVRVYSESFEENLIFLFWNNRAHKALGRTHLINRPIAIAGVSAS